MKAPSSCLFAAAIMSVVACAPADAPVDDNSQSSESELSTAAFVLNGIDTEGYAANRPNVGRELAEVGAAKVPGVLTSSTSSSPYVEAATVQLSVWSTVMTMGWDGEPTERVFVRLEGGPTSRAGRAAGKIFDAMTNATETVETGGTIRRSSKGSVTCMRSPDHTQCMLGPLNRVEPR